MALAILGMRGSGSYSTNVERPQSWREAILLLFPNGKAPLTAIMSKLSSEPVDDPIFHWFEKDVPVQRVATTASVGAAVTTLTIADSSIFRAGHVIMEEVTLEKMLVVSDPTSATQINVQRAFGTTAAASVTSGDNLLIIGNANAEGASSANVISYSPTTPSNNTQIFRNSLYLTRTAMKTRLRTGNSREEAKRETLELHSIEMEKAAIFGEPFSSTGANGQPMLTTGGVVSFLGADATFTNITDFSSTTFNIANWENALENFFKYGASEKLLLAGSTFINQLNQLVKKSSVMNLVPGDTSYGMKIREYETPFGTLYVKMHPLLSIHPTFKSWGLGLDVSKLRFRYIDDTDFRPNIQMPDMDAQKDEFLTEWGLELQHQKAHALYKNVTTFVA